MPALLAVPRVAGGQFWMVQFIGPIKDDWLDAVGKTGAQLVSYLPENAYVVWGDGTALARLDAVAAASRFVQWTGAYHPYYRLSPGLREAAVRGAADEADKSGASELVSVWVQMYRTPGIGATLDKLVTLAKAAGGGVLKDRADVLVYTNVSLALPVSALAEVAAWNDVFALGEYSTPRKMDEAQNQVMAGNWVLSGTAVVPSGPGYLTWLASKGFPTSPNAYQIVDVVDDGIDTGNQDNLLHPDFYVLGNRANADRVPYLTTCTSDLSTNGLAGHGNLNAGIVAGYNDRSGFPYVDADGLNRGLGVSPYGRVASTKIFLDNGAYSVSACGNTDPGVVLKSYQMGARITSNSWGNSSFGVYDDSSQAYDALTRDANNTVADGNQPMLHIFASGNSSSASAGGSPGTAKNVITVGASENVRDNGVQDGCSTSAANNANDMATFSLGGPLLDGRAKPDTVAAGTHVAGPASFDAGFDGTGVCGPATGLYYPAGQITYTWSSGTSHSTPAVAGAAQLIWEYYGRVLNPGKTPSPAMVKALVVNTPRYMDGVLAGGNLPGPRQGFGAINLGKTFDGVPRRVIDQERVFAASGEQYVLAGDVGDAGQPFHVSLVWTDAPGPLSGNAYVNNLDLEVAVGGQTYRGNVFSGATSVTGGSFDVRNNVENVLVPAGASGTYSIRVIATNIGGDGVPGNSDATDQDFALVVYNTRDASIRGTVTNAANGSGIGGAVITARKGVTEAFLGYTTASGDYALTLPEGDYQLSAKAYGFVPSGVVSVTAAFGLSITQPFTLTPAPTAVISGVVTDSATSAPLRAVIAVSSDPPPYDDLTAATDKVTGFYSVTVSSQQPITLSVAALLHAPQARGLNQVSSDRTESFALVATTPNGILTGRVLDGGSGNPLAGAVVGLNGLTQTAVSAGDGTYMLMGIPPGNYTVTASLDPYAPASVPGVVVPQSNIAELDILLERSVASITPTVISRTLDFGLEATDPAAIQIANLGKGQLLWNLFETPGPGGQAPTPTVLIANTSLLSLTESTRAITLAVSGAGYGYDLIDSSGLESIGLDALQTYAAVIAFGARGGQATLLAKLQSYLDAGGRLVVMDNDFGFYNRDTSFYTDTLQAAYVSDNACSSAGNCALAGTDILLGLSGGVETDPFPDRFDARAQATHILRYADGDPAGTRIERNGYRAVYLSFDFEYLGGAAAGDLVEREVMRRILAWLGGAGDVLAFVDVTPVSGSVAPSGTVDVDVTWRAVPGRLRTPGVFMGRLLATTNDPNALATTIDLILTVVSTPDVGELRGTVSSLGVCSAAPAQLPGASIDVLGESGPPFRLWSGEEGAYDQALLQGVYTLTVSAPGHVTKHLTVTVPPGGEAVADVDLTLDRSCMSLSPTAIAAGAASGNVISVSLVISNSGPQPLTVTPLEQPAPAAARAAGGPDPFGYSFRTSNDPGGPIFGWIVPAGGTALDLADDGLANITLPFTFTFYDRSTRALRISNNGGILVGATSGSLSYDNASMNGANTPNYLIAPFWDDIDDSGGNVYWSALGAAPNRRVVITWQNRPHFSDVGAATFQAVLHESGTVLFQYLDADFGDPRFDAGASATVGMRGGNATNSLQHSSNTAAVPNLYAMCFFLPGAADCGSTDIPWLSLTPSALFTVTGSQAMNVRLDATVAITPGVYRAQIALSNNSPASLVLVPVEFTVSTERRIYLPIVNRAGASH